MVVSLLLSGVLLHSVMEYQRRMNNFAFSERCHLHIGRYKSRHYEVRRPPPRGGNKWLWIGKTRPFYEEPLGTLL